MTVNIIVFKFKPEYKDNKTRNKKKITIISVAIDLCNNECHMAISLDPIDEILKKILNEFNMNTDDDHNEMFVIEKNDGYLVINYFSSFRTRVLVGLQRALKGTEYCASEV